MINDKRRGEPPFNSRELRGRIKVSNLGTLFLSSTSFLAFVKCAYQAYYTKYKPVEFEEGPMPAALCFGTAVHSSMEYYNRIGRMAIFELYWREYKDIEMAYTAAEEGYQHLLYTGAEILNRIVSVHESEEIGLPYKLSDGSLAVERQDSYRVSPRLFLGRTFDLIAPVKGVPTVIDYKTAARMYSEGNQDEINEQLTAYLLPHKLKGVPQVEQAAFIVGTKTKMPRAKMFIVKRSEMRMQQFLEDIEAVEECIRRDIKVRSRSVFNCGTRTRPYCNFWTECYGEKE